MSVAVSSFAALADRHDKQDLVRTLMRLAVTGRVVEHGGKFTLPLLPNFGFRSAKVGTQPQRC